ncbi:hypothetical protein [Paucibacter sp. XJ19-41]|uniref:hypothetical protein n=1 Tax=Paucibacter sp. XJ19-41 TaxID=2927824 RepID=UPI002349B3CD|nr:hypothetical protein [Paucibacter sp. XJ19-41]MDC6170704.1 hypothetical protein [Paucibacter sp. XJ19-41]
MTQASQERQSYAVEVTARVRQSAAPCEFKCLTNLSPRGGRMECCRQATEAHYLAWLREVNGTDHALMHEHLMQTLDRLAPTARQAFPHGLSVRVAELPGAQARAFTGKCRTCSGAIQLVVVDARLMFWVWRLLASAAGRIMTWNPPRFTYRTTAGLSAEEASAHNAQVATAISYLRPKLSTQHLDALVHDLDACPQPARNLALTFADYAELWILLHEVVHTTDVAIFQAASPEALAGEQVPEDQVPSWNEELRADCHAMDILRQAQSHAAQLGGQLPEDSLRGMFSVFGGVEFALRAIDFCDEIECVQSTTHPSASRRFACLQNLVESRRHELLPGWDYWEWRKPFLVAWEVLLDDYRKQYPGTFGSPRPEEGSNQTCPAKPA